MKRTLLPLVLAPLALALFAAACKPPDQSPRGFRLPEGDIERGKEAFVSLNCYACHTVDGVALPPATAEQVLPLGGEVARLKTYGQLVTAVIHPSHNLAPAFKEKLERGEISPMPQFNDSMTVSQMIDIVTFLQSRYRALEYDPIYYP